MLRENSNLCTAQTKDFFEVYKISFYDHYVVLKIMTYLAKVQCQNAVLAIYFIG